MINVILVFFMVFEKIFAISSTVLIDDFENDDDIVPYMQRKRSFPIQAFT